MMKWANKYLSSIVGGQKLEREESTCYRDRTLKYGYGEMLLALGFISQNGKIDSYK
ncbi:hypothetical protein [Chamaesiphon minutus]|uniref:Uncharacterized protein n=1 Tax=Chamaesiphon minutus (strain ATCC 27169 / PCC 6605) TaxID=1173020 RepID=K9UHQ0_CHAP6|nr:hypothetical protein [Chamaesiphon minutus]AFY93976.1 hypothetical protein Cha6605_2944 [Chamaesiphon minutus PCC 6605]